MQVSTAYGVLTLEAKWLVPAGTLPADVARDPNSCLIAVTIDLHEHPIAYAARVLRESGATPAQTKVGIQLAFGKAKPVIADALGIQLTSVADRTRKLYQTLDVHNSAELATKIWLGQRQDAARRISFFGTTRFARLLMLVETFSSAQNRAWPGDVPRGGHSPPLAASPPSCYIAALNPASFRRPCAGPLI